jgi:hypothetical protein
MVDITIANGVYKATFNWGATILWFPRHSQLCRGLFSIEHVVKVRFSAMFFPEQKKH